MRTFEDINFKKFIFVFFFIFPAIAYANFNSNDEKGTKNKSNRQTAKAEEFEEYENKIIRFIHIYARDVSGPSIEDDSTWKPSWAGNVANSLHFKTRNWVVRNRLLIKEGDHLNPTLLAESERILRSTGVFLDARIKITPVKNYKDSVDIVVITQDKWTLSLLASYNTNAKNGYLGLGDENFLGLGHILNLRYTHDEEKAVGSGGIFEYTATNIGGSFINAEGRIESNGRSNFKGIDFSRPFLTTHIHWSGALTFNWLNDVFKYSDSSDGMKAFPYKKISQDVWLGRTFSLSFLPYQLFKNTDFFTSARIYHVDYPENPDNSKISEKIFDSNTQYLFSTGFINRHFYKDSFVNAFGVTEDIPVGGIFSTTFGKDLKPNSNRWYTGIELIYSRRIPGIGYSSADFKLGGFKHMGDWEQDIFNFNFIYHSLLLKKEKWKYRFFLQTDLLYGFNRLQGEQIYLNSQNGLRGFDDILLFGTKRITLNLETRIFSPFSPLGFVLGGIVFSDFGLITNNGISLTKSKLYQSYGIGLRTRNESITNTNFVISIAYIPINNRTTGGTFKLLFNTSIVLGIRDFGLDSPSIFKFGDNQ
jgi:hypothetical protein